MGSNPPSHPYILLNPKNGDLFDPFIVFVLFTSEGNGDEHEQPGAKCLSLSFLLPYL